MDKDYYKHHAKQLSDYAIQWNLEDIKTTLDLHKDKPTDHPYVAQLLRQWDVLLDEKMARAKPARRRVRQASDPDRGTTAYNAWAAYFKNRVY